MGTHQHPHRNAGQTGLWLSRRNLLLTGAAALVAGTTAACGQGEPSGNGSAQDASSATGSAGR